MIFKVFIDSDVIISSLISTKGAAFLLLSQPNSRYFYSSVQVKELKIVCDRLNISHKKLENILKNISQKSIDQNDKIYSDFVNDPNDIHILAGAHQSSAKFLITYNQKDFKAEKIKSRFNITILTPALFLQYLRSLV